MTWNRGKAFAFSIGASEVEDGEEAKTARGRSQDRARVAGKQATELSMRRRRRAASAVKKAVKKVGNSRKRVEKSLKGKR